MSCPPRRDCWLLMFNCPLTHFSPPQPAPAEAGGEELPSGVLEVVNQPCRAGRRHRGNEAALPAPRGRGGGLQPSLAAFGGPGAPRGVGGAPCSPPVHTSPCWLCPSSPIPKFPFGIQKSSWEDRKPPSGCLQVLPTFFPALGGAKMRGKHEDLGADPIPCPPQPLPGQVFAAQTSFPAHTLAQGLKFPLG